MLDGHVFTCAEGTRGFDTNGTISREAATAFLEHGYRFCVRYVRRQAVHPFDLTPSEAQSILSAGLGLMAVQHVAGPGWVPSKKLGKAYGAIAAEEAQRIGIPAGVSVWCDLEGVARHTKGSAVIDYCNTWHIQLAGAGFVPGLYVGDRAGLSADQLYDELRFTHYWGAYNLNSDEEPSVRGLQMKQTEATTADKVPGYGFAFQADMVIGDRLGGRPTVVAPAGWSE
jgi:hypothetical protein